ncbi:hypothetical protein GDO78_019772 [Eleutherodactylus coqui]|uniref:Uncharacterized protein n=1 Tax=Eleutherodactylus coqui TaxID=57060 RepID=A0A8J6E307_ELECQ|nr:hypothetical protein GDO78_019772 [Eleutherodactylus coqui]
MQKDRNKMAESVLNLILDILFQLTGKDYTVVKKTSSAGCRAPVCDGWDRPLSPIPVLPPHPLIHEDINVQKILELANKMIELLTGEVSGCRCLFLHGGVGVFRRTQGSVQGRHDGDPPAAPITR